MESKIGMISKVIKIHNNEWLTASEISSYIEDLFTIKLNSRMINKCITELIEVGYVIRIKTAAHNTRLYYFEGVIINDVIF